MHLVNLAFALSEAGQLAEAEKVAKAGAEQVASNRVYIAQIFFGVNLGRIALMQGRLETARRYYAEAAGLAEASRFAGPRRLALSGLAVAHAMRGEADAAAQALTEREALPPFGFRGPEQQLADGWTAWVRGRPRDAAARFRDAAAHAVETGHRTAEAWILHDLSRISGEDTSARLQELASSCDSPLVSGRARHVAALSAHDAQELMSVADDFEELGAMLLAAEAMTAAADVLIRTGQRRASTAAQQRAGVLCAFCEGAATPGLSNAGAAAVLSEREREIGMLAAKGLSSKDIAERLYLSVRTVNNHLEHIYTKLGITSRAGLAQTLGGH
jgi:ATP/maltotriose-dependent transcriptional regulator MalT